MLSPTSRIRYEVSFRLRRAFRASQNLLMTNRFAKYRSPDQLPHLIQSHETPIFRHLKGVDSKLFSNKRENLRLAIEKINRVTIPPGKLFSFWQLVGEPIASKGYLPGLVISRGSPTEGVGGGLCQLSNALFWLALHTDLIVTERHRHSFDLFPDDSRLVPFGTGATVLFNYKDLRFYNPTTWTYQFAFELSATTLVAKVFCSDQLPHQFQIRETDHQFESTNGGVYRRNKLWKVKKGVAPHDDELSTDLLFENHCRCQYEINR